MRIERRGSGIASGMALVSRGATHRIGAALGAALVQGALLYLLIAGLGVKLPRTVQPVTRLLDFTLPEPPPPEPVAEPEPRKAPKREGEGAPPNLVSRATEIVVPPPALPLPVMPVAPRADTGGDASSGNAPVTGPGTGAGGQGNGPGSGGAGNGPGGGGGTVLRLLRGRITGRDYPKQALEAGASGTVGLRFVVGTNGRVTDCTVTRSSGNASLDETTCRLIRERFRYAPSRDARGRAYADTVTGEHVWELYDRPRPDAREDSTDE